MYLSNIELFIISLPNLYETQHFMGAAAFFAGVAWQLPSINGKQFSPDQALCITSYQHLAKQGFDLIA